MAKEAEATIYATFAGYRMTPDSAPVPGPFTIRVRRDITKKKKIRYVAEVLPIGERFRGEGWNDCRDIRFMRDRV